MLSAAAMARNRLGEIRAENQTEFERRHAEVRERSPRYAEIEAELRRAGNALLRSVLDGSHRFEEIRGYITARQNEKKEILKSLHLPADYLDEIYNCPICHDTGFDINGLKCGCLKELTAGYVDYNSNLTGILKEQTFENFDFSLFSDKSGGEKASPLRLAKIMYSRAEKFADTFDAEKLPGLFIRGGVGTGKTYLSSCIGNRALSRGLTVYYQTSYKLCSMMEAAHFDKITNEDELQNTRDILSYAQNADLLIIDDLGTEFLTSFTAAALFDLVNTRLMRRLSTVISTNLDFGKLDELYSARFTSRIVGEYEIITTAVGDLRKSSRGL